MAAAHGATQAEAEPKLSMNVCHCSSHMDAGQSSGEPAGVQESRC